jgi:hypothetical protein
MRVHNDLASLTEDSEELMSQDEKTLHNFFYEVIKNDFYTAHEVEGICLINHPSLDNPAVRADFLLYPRQHLLDAGFADTWFAVEVKTAQEKMEKCLNQAFWYTISQFNIKDQLIVPGFAVGYQPNWEFNSLGDLKWKEKSLIKKNEQERQEQWHRQYLTQRKAILRTFCYFNVGVIRLNTQNGYKWRLQFHDVYASDYKDRGIKIAQNRKAFRLNPGNSRKEATHSGLFNSTKETKGKDN